MSDQSVVRLKPDQYIHVLDNNTNVTRVLVGPLTFTKKEEEKVVLGPEQMISIPPRHCCRIVNPVLRNSSGEIVVDSIGQVVLRFGDEEIRFEQAMFPLYPGERLSGSVTPLTVVAENTALRLKALRDFEGHKAGDEWLFIGPDTYTPHVAVQVKEKVAATLLKPNQALRLRARFATNDRDGVARRAGEEWLIRDVGAYLPGVDEVVVQTIDAVVLTEKKALHLRALRTFTDSFGKTRKAGQQWLVTHLDAETHIPDVYEEVVGEVPVTSLNSRQYCVILDPFDPETGKAHLGVRQLRKGETRFFLQPGERLENNRIENVHVLDAQEALLLRAREAFLDGTTQRRPGDRWMITGPTDYIPPVTVDIIERRKAISLDDNEGIYVRDIKTGRVRSVIGQSYMLNPNEELWAKELPEIVEALLVNTSVEVHPDAAPLKKKAAPRDKTRVVSYRAPHNSLVQIYDYKAKLARVVFGPDLVMLGPEEQFTIVTLSGGKPKVPNYVKTLATFFGPDFMTDIITVETADHARLQLQLSYSWSFNIDRNADQPVLEQQAAKVFNVPDFIGDACKSLASRIRSAVAATPFDLFHKQSSDIIRRAVFGTAADGRTIRNEWMNESNRLVISSIDIQSVEPVDQRTRDSLQKSVQLAIEITVQSQEAAARHEAERTEQEARARLDRSKIKDEVDSERARMALLVLQATSLAVEATGSATAEAKARADSSQIEGEAAVRQAELKAEAVTIEADADLIQIKERNLAELEHQKQLAELETYRQQRLADIEAVRFAEVVGSIGAGTIEAIARAGPEMQAKLLQGLGLQGYLVTDGNSPINLFQQANSFISQTQASGLGL
eukprot:TRINITY_DN107_c0_g2_i1.p1 TRINITY_DN107_c0_g2~~TRINITY_DN107_c0_g2_i1.p1  ORF type:complete len:860 (-),score=240.90 TRINITY_DN107_c0_g2_i1:70-2598(-)